MRAMQQPMPVPVVKQRIARGGAAARQPSTAAAAAAAAVDCDRSLSMLGSPSRSAEECQLSEPCVSSVENAKMSRSGVRRHTVAGTPRKQGENKLRWLGPSGTFCSGETNRREAVVGYSQYSSEESSGAVGNRGAAKTSGCDTGLRARKIM